MLACLLQFVIRRDAGTRIMSMRFDESDQGALAEIVTTSDVGRASGRWNMAAYFIAGGLVAICLAVAGIMARRCRQDSGEEH